MAYTEHTSLSTNRPYYYNKLTGKSQWYKSDIHVNFPGRIIIIGFGSIGQGVLPLILRHIGRITSDSIAIITADERGRDVAQEYGISFTINPLTKENYRKILVPMIDSGDFVLNVSVNVSSVAIMELCAERGALYLDTCSEPWEGDYIDDSVPPERRTNYHLREEILALRRKLGITSPTAVVTHGANPGLVQHFVKQALLDISDNPVKEPTCREEWAELARKLGVKVMHIAERDTQVPTIAKKAGEFVNTWSVDGFVGEGSQPAELGWGVHEKHFPLDGRRQTEGSCCAIYLMQPGAATRVRTWTPHAGPFHGFLITHSESISLSDYYTVKKDKSVLYRPTVHYAYHPADSAIVSLHELAGRNWQQQEMQRIMMNDILPNGIDELGILLAGHKKNAYWYGSQLSVDEARRLAPHNSATSLQVTVACLAGIVWAIENPNRGILEPDEIDFRRILDICMPYLGPVIGRYTDWTPLTGRSKLFPEDIDSSDPWQFKNIRV